MKKKLLLVCCSLLSACASQYASNAEKSYLKANNGPMVVVPAPLSNQELSHYYVLPELKGAPGASLLPPVALDPHEPSRVRKEANSSRVVD